MENNVRENVREGAKIRGKNEEATIWQKREKGKRERKSKKKIRKERERRGKNRGNGDILGSEEETRKSGSRGKWERER